MECLSIVQVINEKENKELSTVLNPIQSSLNNMSFSQVI